MADDTRTWVEIAVAAFASSGLYALVQYIFSGRKKEGSESDKLRAETSALKQKSEIEWVDFYKKELSSALINIDELQKKYKAKQDEYDKLYDTLESLKRTLTMLQLQLNNK